MSLQSLFISFRLAPIAVLLSLLGTFLFDQARVALADSPVVVVASWDSPNQCVKFAYGAYDVDTVARDGLAGEWYSTDPKQALRAGAVLIRSDAIYFRDHPEYTDPVAGRTCAGVTQFYFNMRNSRLEGWGPGKGATDRGTSNNVPDNQVTLTGGRAMLQSGIVNFYPFNTCLQGQTVTLANQGYNYTQILTDPNIGVYRSGNQCVTARSNLSINTSYYAFSDSITNGTAPYYNQGNTPPFSDFVPYYGVHTSEITSEGGSRQAERYWGVVHITSTDYDVDHPPPPEPGIYAKGTGRGDKAEYRMSFGGAHQNTIRISGIDDHPAPVIVNIYVDGIFQFPMGWYTGDDARRQISQRLGNSGQFTAGTHALAIEFVEDYFHPEYCPPPTPVSDCDRNMYLDNFLVTNP